MHALSLNLYLSLLVYKGPKADSRNENVPVVRKRQPQLINAGATVGKRPAFATAILRSVIGYQRDSLRHSGSPQRGLGGEEPLHASLMHPSFTLPPLSDCFILGWDQATPSLRNRTYCSRQKSDPTQRAQNDPCMFPWISSSRVRIIF
jgi:hypothetical protein